MQLFTCPFCGQRTENEFYYAGEAGTVRPMPADEVSEEVWSDYLYSNDNPKGVTEEIWIHLTCNEAFRMQRDTATHAVIACEALPHWSGPEGGV